MYVNFNLIASRNFNPQDAVFLQLISQNKVEDLSETIEKSMGAEYLHFYEEEGLITYVKGSKNDSIFKKVRLSSKGATFLEDLQVPEITEEDLIFYDWLEGIYKSTDRAVGNRRKTKAWIANFRAHSGIEKNRLAFLCKKFIDDPSEFEWSKVLEYLFFKPSTVYQVKFDIEQSRLYQYYLKHKQFFDTKFETLQ
jgi:hypothetical protein